jgi:bacterioferritin-associated ferredoxin
VRISGEFQAWEVPPQVATSSTAAVNTVTSSEPVRSTCAVLDRVGRCRKAAAAMMATTPMGRLM